MVPSMPRSLVKLASREASVSTGASSSRPASDQVPQEMYAKCGPVAGTAATAEAVSCEATVTTAVSAGSPVYAATWGRSVPAWVPGRRSGGSRRGSMPSRPRSSSAQVAVRASKRPVVEALVSSAPMSPVSQWVSRSGIISSVRAAANCAPSRAAASWKTVLKGRCCNPVIPYSS